MIEVEATSAVVVATEERELVSIIWLSLFAIRSTVCVASEDWLDDNQIHVLWKETN